MYIVTSFLLCESLGWFGSAMVLGVLLIWLIVGQGPTALQWVRVCVAWTFFLLYFFSSLSPSLWETARYRLKYCLKGL